MRLLLACCLVIAACSTTACVGGSEAESGVDVVLGLSDAAGETAISPWPDTSGGACRLARSWEDNGVAAHDCRRVAYDEHGREVLRALDVECDGVEERCWREEWDAAGRRTLSYEDAGCDATLDVGCNSWSYDDVLRTETSTEDGDCDGAPDFVRTRTRDEASRVIREEVQEGLEGGFAHSCSAYTFDRLGNQTDERLDESCDGTWEWCQVTTLDGLGEQVGSHMDMLCDGVPDRNCRTVERLAAAIGGFETVQRLDRTCDGVDLTCWRTATNAQGLEVAQEVDAGCDGAGERCTVSEYDAGGSLLRRTLAAPCDSAPRVCAETLTVDAQGRPVASQADPECTGVPSNCVTTAYDEAGRVAETTFAPLCDGAAPTCERFAYDAHGNVVSDRTERPCGGEYALDRRFEFTCGP